MDKTIADAIAFLLVIVWAILIGRKIWLGKAKSRLEMDTDKNKILEVTAVKGRRGKWNIQIAQDTMLFSSKYGDESLSIVRPQADEIVELQKNFKSRFLIIKFPKDKINFKLDEKAADDIKEFFTPPTLNGLKASLKRKFRGLLPIGIFIALVSLPFPADQGSGAEAIPADPVGLILGVTLIAIAVIRRWYPKRIFFAIDGLWCIALGINVIFNVIKGSDSFIWIVSPIILFMIAKGRFDEYKRFSNIVNINDNSTQNNVKIDHQSGKPIEPGN